MTATPDRILTQSYCHAMVAVDSIGPIVQRVENLLAHGRRISIARHYLNSDAPAKVVAGLTADEMRVKRTDAGGGIARHYLNSDAPAKVVAGLTVDEMRVKRTDAGGGIGVHLKPGTESFGLSAYPGDPATEREAWTRFHLNDRSGLVRITFTGGLPDSGPNRDDQMVIRRWTPGGGQCEEIVVGFDYGPDQQQIREDTAKHLCMADGGDPALWDKLTDAAWGIGDAKLDGAGERERFLAAADQVLAIAWRD